MAISTQVTVTLTLSLTEVRAIRTLLGDLTGAQQIGLLHDAGKKKQEYSDAIDRVYSALDLNGD